MLSAQPIGVVFTLNGSGSSPAIRGRSGISALRPTVSSQSPRGRGVSGGDQLSVVGCRVSGGGVDFPVRGKPVFPAARSRPRLDLLEPTIRQLLATISPLAQPRSEALPERTTALLLTFPDASGRNLEILHRLTPATRHWATQSIHLLTACLTRMQLLPTLTTVPIANRGSSFGTGPMAL